MIVVQVLITEKGPVPDDTAHFINMADGIADWLIVKPNVYSLSFHTRTDYMTFTKRLMQSRRLVTIEIKFSAW